MRRPREDVLPPSDRLRVLPLDVTDPASIGQAVDAAGPIDVLVNNAGIGWLNALEGTPMTAARELFETNALGTMAMTQAVLPQMRERRAGVIVNVTSSVTLRPLPLLSVYTASKAAVNAFTESLALRAGAVRRPGAPGAAGPGPGDALRRQRPRAACGTASPRPTPASRSKVFAAIGQARRPITRASRRGRRGVAGGDRPVVPDAAPCRRRCGSSRRRPFVTGGDRA